MLWMNDVSPHRLLGGDDYEKKAMIWRVNVVQNMVLYTML